ncbi:hypothetical protein BSQ39_01510 [Loigolactobacillus backii]|uniref:hypothetical protein n=1 Tax=Loigolactobacillus backii TaxID=375175 RepID=UPI000C1CABC2|nr:hypothetical protein [Loigolactobacillus backii]PIO82331.1 hypothetical protein BSQ39_01510 [Loigolactobacillus backii]
MNSILTELQTAQREHLLINLYQTAHDVIYTGYVTELNESGVIMQTFDDAGLQDGLVFLALNVIEAVEFDSDDLDSMAYRIQNAQQAHFVTSLQAPFKFTGQQDLLPQLIQQAIKRQTMVLLVLKDRDMYLEGTIQAQTSGTIDFHVFDKFDYTNQTILSVTTEQIQVIEFLGKELTLEGALVKSNLVHQATKQETTTLAMVATLHQAQKRHQLISLSTSDDDDLFFVGWVNTLTNTSVVINLVDMNGQFGGYVLMQLETLQQVTEISDYLQTIAFFIRRNVLFKQPVLNDERLFDPTVDLFQTVLQQAQYFKRIIRVKLINEDEGLVGVPTDLNADQLTFKILASDDEEDLDTVAVPLVAISEIAFDYMDAYLLEQELKATGDL